MKLLIRYILLSVVLLTTSCYDDPGTEIVFEGSQVEFESAVTLSKATGELFPIISLNRVSGTPSFRVNLVGKQLPQAESINHSLEEVPDRLLNTNTIKAVEGVHFVFNGNSISFPEQTSTATFSPFSIKTDYPAQPGKVALFIIRLDGNDRLKPSENFRRLAFQINLDVDNPTMTFSLRGQWGAIVNNVRQRPIVTLRNGARDTVNIVFNREIRATNPPVVTKSAATTTWANIGTPVAYENNDGIANNSFYVPVEATSLGNGNLSLIVTGAVSSIGAPIVANNTTNVTSLVVVDNAPPQAVSRAWSAERIGRTQSSTVTVTFNEPMSPSVQDSVYVSISGQNIDPIINRRMTLASNGLSATYAYTYRDSSNPTDVTSGDLLIAYGGGKDLAGNALNIASIALGGLSTDVSSLNAATNAVITPAPNVPVITLPSPYDFGTQISWSFAVTGPGSTTGTLFYLILRDATIPPSTFQQFQNVQGVRVYNGFNLTGIAASNISAQGSIPVSAGTTGVVFTPFLPNGNFDVYAYWVTNTGNASPVSGILADITTQ
jgi:hypothetical protein